MLSQAQGREEAHGRACPLCCALLQPHLVLGPGLGSLHVGTMQRALNEEEQAWGMQHGP